MDKTKRAPAVIEKQDAFDIASAPKRRGRPPKVQQPVKQVIEEDTEDMSEQEAEAIVLKADQRKEETKNKLEASVDSQVWTNADPVIPEDLKARVWVAVYKCPEGHKTKATNRQAETGVNCAKCRERGALIRADVMPQFLEKPVPPDDDLEKRRKARKGAE